MMVMCNVIKGRDGRRRKKKKKKKKKIRAF